MARKLEREQKKKVEGGGGGSFFPLPLPRHSFFFFALVPTFRDELTRKRLLRRLMITVLIFIERKDNTRRGGPSPLPLKRNRGDPVSGYRVAVHSIPSFQACTGSSLEERGCLVSRFLLTVRRIPIGKEHLLGVSPSPHSSICQSWE